VVTAAGVSELTSPPERSDRSDLREGEAWLSRWESPKLSTEYEVRAREKNKDFFFSSIPSFPLSSLFSLFLPHERKNRTDNFCALPSGYTKLELLQTNEKKIPFKRNIFSDKKKAS
jgi:hypothetical protein